MPDAPQAITAPPLILASRSPQRKAILEQLGVPFEVVVPDVDEIAEGDPVEVARTNARLKADAIAARRRAAGDDRPILATDTVVRLGDTVYGKPRDERHAAEILTALSGHTHEVVSGLALHREGATETLHATARVQFRDLQPLLQWYLRTGEWAERAGAYAIQGQGAAFVASIEGDYLNVVGLPVAALLDTWPEVLHLRQ